MTSEPPLPASSAPRLHLNEHLSPRLAAQLRNHGFDVTATQETALRTAPDEDQLAYAVANRRAIVTFNVSDFSRLHDEYLQADKEHWGIVLSTPEPIGVLFHCLLRLLNTRSSEELKGQIWWLNDFR